MDGVPVMEVDPCRNPRLSGVEQSEIGSPDAAQVTRGVGRGGNPVFPVIVDRRPRHGDRSRPPAGLIVGPGGHRPCVSPRRRVDVVGVPGRRSLGPVPEIPLIRRRRGAAGRRRRRRERDRRAGDGRGRPGCRAGQAAGSGRHLRQDDVIDVDALVGNRCIRNEGQSQPDLRLPQRVEAGDIGGIERSGRPPLGIARRDESREILAVDGETVEKFVGILIAVGRLGLHPEVEIHGRFLGVRQREGTEDHPDLHIVEIRAALRRRLVTAPGTVNTPAAPRRTIIGLAPEGRTRTVELPRPGKGSLEVVVDQRFRRLVFPIADHPRLTVRRRRHFRRSPGRELRAVNPTGISQRHDHHRRTNEPTKLHTDLRDTHLRFLFLFPAQTPSSVSPVSIHSRFQDR